jgi:hypothetical protein
MSETEKAIASLRSSIDALHSLVAGVHAQVSAKAESSIVADLSTRITSCEGRITTLGSPVTAQGHAVTALTSRINTGNAPVVERSSLAINLGEAIEPLRMGGVTFYGESARVIRDAQGVLQAAGAGQLEVVKRESREGSPFFVVDGQVFISEAEIKAPIDAGQLLGELTKQIAESKLGASLESRIAEIEKGRSKQGAENRALHDRLTALELDLVASKGRADAEHVRAEQRLDALERRLAQQGPFFSASPRTVLLGSASDNSRATAYSQSKPE